MHVREYTCRNEKNEELRSFEFGKTKWVVGRDENPSCKHKKVIVHFGNCAWFPHKNSDILRVVRHWICSKCLARGIDVLESVPFDRKEVDKLNWRRNRTKVPFESLEGVDIMFNEIDEVGG